MTLLCVSGPVRLWLSQLHHKRSRHCSSLRLLVSTCSRGCPLHRLPSENPAPPAACPPGGQALKGFALEHQVFNGLLCFSADDTGGRRLGVDTRLPRPRLPCSRAHHKKLQAAASRVVVALLSHDDHLGCGIRRHCRLASGRLRSPPRLHLLHVLLEVLHALSERSPI